MLAGQGPEAGRLDGLMVDGREMKGSDSRPRPASACPHPALIHPPALILQTRLAAPASVSAPRLLSVKAAEIQVKAVRPGQGPATLTAPRTVSPSQLFGKLDLFTCSKLP